MKPVTSKTNLTSRPKCLSSRHADGSEQHPAGVREPSRLWAAALSSWEEALQCRSSHQALRHVSQADAQPATNVQYALQEFATMYPAASISALNECLSLHASLTCRGAARNPWSKLRINFWMSTSKRWVKLLRQPGVSVSASGVQAIHNLVLYNVARGQLDPSTLLKPVLQF